MFIKTDQNYNIISYPYSLEQFRQDHRNMSLPQFLNNKFLANNNVYPVYVAPEPEFDTITQFAVKDVDNPYRDTDGEWKIGWIIKNKTAEQVQADLEKHRIEFHEKINDARDAAIYQTLTVKVNETTEVPVDIRKGTPDIQNISGLAQTATLQLINGDVTSIFFRGADDIVYELSPQEVITLARSVSDKYSACYKKSWEYKDRLVSATSIEEINSIVLDF